MSTIRCPRCRDEVTVPPRATSRALVRCPLCLEQYLLSEALANAPPPLVIIGGEVEEAAIERTEEPLGGYQIAAANFGDEESQSRAVAAAAVSLARPAIRPTGRARRKEGGGVMFVASVMAGGLLAAPLAMLTLWWVFGVDPPELGLGPKVARFAPWLVPAKLRGDADTELPQETVIVPPAVKKGKPRQATAAAEPVMELQTLPGLDEPGPPADRLKPAIDLPVLQESAPKSKKVAPSPEEKAPKENTVDESKSDEEGAKSRPPMPDLRELLPEGSE
jgi:hypothetical protein